MLSRLEPPGANEGRESFEDEIGLERHQVLGSARQRGTGGLDAIDEGGNTFWVSDIASWPALATFVVASALLVCGTSFLKFSVVLSLLRRALGLRDAPSGFALTVLAGLLSLFVMKPVADEVLLALGDAEPSGAVLISQAHAPLLRFFERNSDKNEQARFARLLQRDANTKNSASGSADSKTKTALLGTSYRFWSYLAAFAVTELSEAFIIGFLLFLPFLVVDLFASSTLVALGLTGLEPAAVTLPIKLLLFVLVGGWGILSESLVLGYR